MSVLTHVADPSDGVAPPVGGGLPRPGRRAGTGR